MATISNNMQLAAEIISTLCNQYNKSNKESYVLDFKKNINKIMMNSNDFMLKEYLISIGNVISMFEKYENLTEENASIAYALIKFLKEPEEFLQKINYNGINKNDETNSTLKFNVVKLCISYLSSSLSEYWASSHHKEIVDTANNSLLI